MSQDLKDSLNVNVQPGAIFSGFEDQQMTYTKGGHPMFYRIIEELSQLHERKNTDYADGMKEGPLGNFHRTAAIQALYPSMNWASPFGVAIAYMLKQLDAALVLKSTRRESVAGEPVNDRMKDVAVYAILTMILDFEERNTESKGTMTKG